LAILIIIWLLKCNTSSPCPQFYLQEAEDLFSHRGVYLDDAGSARCRCHHKPFHPNADREKYERHFGSKRHRDFEAERSLLGVQQAALDEMSEQAAAQERERLRAAATRSTERELNLASLSCEAKGALAGKGCLIYFAVTPPPTSSTSRHHLIMSGLPASAAAEVAPDTDTTLPPGYPPPEKGNRAKPQVVNIRTNLKSKQKPGGYNAFCLFRSHLKHCMINRENMPLDEYLRHRRGLPESKFASLKRKSVNKDGWLAKRLKGKSKKDTNKFFAEMWRYLGEANPEKKKLYKQKAMEIKQELAQRELARDSASKS
jgi:hypothetical protein